MILFGAFFGLILTLNFWKYAYRSNERLKILRDIENERGFRRFAEEEPRPMRWRLLYPMLVFLFIFCGLLILVGLLDRGLAAHKYNDVARGSMAMR